MASRPQQVDEEVGEVEARRQRFLRLREEALASNEELRKRGWKLKPMASLTRLCKSLSSQRPLAAELKACPLGASGTLRG